MKIEWLESGILQLQPESTEDVFKLAEFVERLRKEDVKEAPAHLSKTPAQAEQPVPRELPPEYGVTLSGSPENPIIENHSGKTVIAYVFGTATRNGYGSLNQPLLATSMQPEGIPDGGSLYARGAVPVNLAGQVAVLSPFHSRSLAGPMQNPVQEVWPGQGLIVRATLRSVIFADGQFVSTDEHGAFELFNNRMQAVREVGMMAKAGEWEQIEALATALTNTKLLLRRLC